LSLITTHVLDTAAGEPAANIPVELEYQEGPESPWIFLDRGKTDADGRLKDLLTRGQAIKQGRYRLRFDTAARSPFFPEVVIQFVVIDLQQPYHVPLLLTRFGYSTYLGK
jgi:5-hydroxyisourate hydrolase